MKNIILSVLFLLVFLHVLFAQKKNRTAASKSKSTVSLFDGKTLDGWIQIPANSWEVRNGVIASLGLGRGVLYTANQYDHYRLMFTVRHLSGKPTTRLPSSSSVRFRLKGRREPMRWLVSSFRCQQEVTGIIDWVTTTAATRLNCFQEAWQTFMNGAG